MLKKVFSWFLKRRKKRVNNFRLDYFIQKQEKIYVLEDGEGVFCTELETYTSFQLLFVADGCVVQKLWN